MCRIMCVCVETEYVLIWDTYVCRMRSAVCWNIILQDSYICRLICWNRICSDARHIYMQNEFCCVCVGNRKYSDVRHLCMQNIHIYTADVIERRWMCVCVIRTYSVSYTRTRTADVIHSMTSAVYIYSVCVCVCVIRTHSVFYTRTRTADVIHSMTSAVRV